MAVNPGNHMAAAVDAEIASYREMQNEIEKMRTDQQILMGQENENEMVKQELSLLEDGTNVFKMVGPVLMKNDLDDAKQTVEKRLEFIKGELSKIATNIEKKEKKTTETAKKVQEMQASLQAAAADAARAIAAQNS